MNLRKPVLPILIAAALVTPCAFAQVLGGNVNVGGGLGAQTGPINVGAGAQTRGDLGLRTDALRNTSRRLRDAAGRAEAEARGAAAVGMSTADRAAAATTAGASGAAQVGSRSALEAQGAGEGSASLGAQAAANASASGQGAVARQAGAAISAGARTAGDAASHGHHVVNQVAGTVSAQGSVEGTIEIPAPSGNAASAASAVIGTSASGSAAATSGPASDGSSASETDAPAASPQKKDKPRSHGKRGSHTP